MEDGVAQAMLAGWGCDLVQGFAIGRPMADADLRRRDLDWTVRSGLAVTALKHSLPGDASLFAPRDIEAFMSGELDVRR